MKKKNRALAVQYNFAFGCGDITIFELIAEDK